jgi:hypothetical protein
MSENPELNDQVNDLIDRYLRFLRGRGPAPDLAHLARPQQRAMLAYFDVVEALADRGPALPPLDEDPVAMRLGLVPGRRPGGEGQPDMAPAEFVAAREYPAEPAQRALQELESAFDGQVDVEWSPSWGVWRHGDLLPLAQCSVLGDSMALFTTEQVSSVEKPANLASFFRGHPDISAVGLVSSDATRAAIVSAADCNRAIDPVRGWLEPGSLVVSEDFGLTLAQYFQQRLPRWERVAGLTELLELGDISADAGQLVATRIDAALRVKPRLEHKKQAQQALRELDPHQLSALIVGVQAGKMTGAEMAERVLTLAEATP